jgi:hypothetical protein
MPGHPPLPHPTDGGASLPGGVQRVAPWPGSQLGLDGRDYAPPAAVGPENDAGDELAAGPLPGQERLTLLAERSEAEQQLSLALEAARLNALADTRKRLAEKVLQAKSEATARWASDRHSSCSRPLGPRVAKCGTRGLAVKCGCGPRVYWRGCRQWWVCRRCRSQRLRPLGARIHESLQARVLDEQRGGARVSLRLVTLTVRHTGDVAADRLQLGDSFRRWYQAMHKWVGRHHYALVYEVTPGTDGKGHVHAHVAILWPRWIDYGRVRTLWLRASQGASERIDIQGVGCNSRRASRYIGKYLSKGSEQLAPELAGRTIAAFYARRAITASRRFWVPRCGCRACGQAVTLDVPELAELQRKQAFVAGLMSAWTARPPPPAPDPTPDTW